MALKYYSPIALVEDVSVSDNTYFQKVETVAEGPDFILLSSENDLNIYKNDPYIRLITTEASNVDELNSKFPFSLNWYIAAKSSVPLDKVIAKALINRLKALAAFRSVQTSLKDIKFSLGEVNVGDLYRQGPAFVKKNELIVDIYIGDELVNGISRRFNLVTGAFKDDNKTFKQPLGAIDVDLVISNKMGYNETAIAVIHVIPDEEYVTGDLQAMYDRPNVVVFHSIDTNEKDYPSLIFRGLDLFEIKRLTSQGKSLRNAKQVQEELEKVQTALENLQTVRDE